MAATEAQKKAKAARELADKETAEANEAIEAARVAKEKAAAEIAEAKEAAAAEIAEAKEAAAAATDAAAEATKAAADVVADVGAQDLANAVSAANEDESPYVNASDVNIFTEKGRVCPKEVVTLSEDVAVKYKGLEPCAKQESE